MYNANDRVINSNNNSCLRAEETCNSRAYLDFLLSNNIGFKKTYINIDKKQEQTIRPTNTEIKRRINRKITKLAGRQAGKQAER